MVNKIVKLEKGLNELKHEVRGNSWTHVEHIEVKGRTKSGDFILGKTKVMKPK